MVSEPNSVLVIKQISLANKEDSHVHTANRSHTCLFAGSRLHSISQLPWLPAVSKSSNPSNSCLSLSDLRKFKPRLTKPTPQTCSKISRDQNPEIRSPKSLPRASTRRRSLRKIPTRRLRFITFRSSSWYTRHHEGLLVHRSTWPENLVVIRRCTRHHAPPGFLVAPSRAGEQCTLLPRADNSADVI